MDKEHYVEPEMEIVEVVGDILTLSNWEVIGGNGDVIGGGEIIGGGDLPPWGGD